MPRLIVTSAFGLEAVVGRELESLGYGNRAVEDGRLSFDADPLAIARCNLWLRSADRVLLSLGEFAAAEFDALFDQLLQLPWDEWLPFDAAIGVRVHAVRSVIRSPRAAQGIVKKAIVERMTRGKQAIRLPETGPLFPVEVTLRGERVTVAIDTSGEGLHKRGYRQAGGPAPLKETLAAGLVALSFWHAGRPFADPFCGSGTLPIEAALIARNIAPGRGRGFLAESWPTLPAACWNDARREVEAAVSSQSPESIVGQDIAPAAIAAARRHAQAAGVAGDIHFQTRPFAEFRSARHFGCLVTNPPYGERVGELSGGDDLARQFQTVWERLPSWSCSVLTGDATFARRVNRPPDRVRKLYNGRIECQYLQYHGPRPPREPDSAREAAAAASTADPMIERAKSPGVALPPGESVPGVCSLSEPPTLLDGGSVLTPPGLASRMEEPNGPLPPGAA